MNTQQIVPGSEFDGYKILELYGRGGMGVVYRAYQTTLDREVAFKVMSLDTSADPKLAERFRHEARTAAKLEHSNIVPIYDFGELNQVVYVTMRLLRGGSLDERRKQHHAQRVTAHEANKLLQPLASALQYAHDQGVIHRDVKGSNILFDEVGVPFVSDLGLAKVVGDVTNRTGSGIILGTPTHMAPEQWDGSVTPAVDQYALAIVMYELLSGRVPFMADTPLALAMMHVQQEPKPLETLVDSMTDETSQVVARGMAKKAEDRYPSVMAFAKAFEWSLGGTDSQYTGFFDVQVKHEVPSPIGDNVPATITPGQPGYNSTPRPAGSTVPDGKTEQMTPPYSTVAQPNNRTGWIVAAAVIAAVMVGVIGWLVYDPQQDGTLRPRQQGVAALSAPDGNATPVATLAANKMYDVNGVSPDDAWYRIQLPNGQEGWVRNSASYVQVRVADESVAVVVSDTPTMTPTATQVPPTPTLTVTPTSEPTNTPRPTTAGGTSIAMGAPIATPPLVDQFATRANWVTSLTFSPDGEELLTASTDGRVRWWDPDPTRLRGTMPGSVDNTVLDIAFNPNITPVGLFFAAGYLDGSVQIWGLGNSQAGAMSSWEAHDGSVFAVDHRFDGTQLVSAGADGTLKLWNLTNLTQIGEFEGHDGAVLDAVFSPDGEKIASAGVDGTVRLWDVASGDEIVMRGHTGAVWSVAFSPDGESLATGSEDGTIKLWTAQGVELQTIFGHEQAVYTVAFNADGTVVASAGEDPIIQIWDFATGTRLTDIVSVDGAILSVTFSPTNDEIAFGGKDGNFRVATITFGDDDDE